MFTGIVQAMGRVAAITLTAAGVRLAIDRAGWQPERGLSIEPGDSICVSGVCLTVTALDEPMLCFDVIGETLARTTLGALKPGDAVNLEPSVTGNTPMSGHFVQGHVEGVGTVIGVKRGGEDVRLTIQPPAELLAYIVPKGSVTVDGVSMTVAKVTAEVFELALIPTTLALTTLGHADAGTRLNVETDILSRTVVYALRQMSGSGPANRVTRDLLQTAGFLG